MSPCEKHIKLSLPSFMLLSCLCLLCMLLGGCGEAEAPAPSESIEVNVEIAALGSVSLSNTYIGSLSAESTVYVIPLVSGEVTEVNVKVGDTVAAGDILGKIDDQPAQLQLDSAQASYNTAKANANSQLGGAWDTQSIQTQSGIEQLYASLNLYERQLSDARRQLWELEYDIRDAARTKDEAYSTLTAAQTKYMTAANLQVNLRGMLAQSIELQSTAGLSAANAQALAIVNQYALENPQEGTASEILQNQEKLWTALNDKAPGQENKLTAAIAITNALQGTGFTVEYLSDSGVAAYKQEAALAQAAYEGAVTGYGTLEGSKPTLESSITQLEGAIEQSLISLQSTQAIASVTEGQTKQETKEIFNSQIEAADVGIDSAKLQLDFYTLTAPISGVVEAVGVTAHGLASPSAAAFTISNTDHMLVTLYVTEDVKNLLHPGMALAVEKKDILYDAVITELGAGADPAKGLFLVKASVDTSGDAFAPGTSVTVSAKTYTEKNAVTIPYDCVYFEANSAYVYVAEDGAAKKRAIETGITDGERIVVHSGLNPGDAVVTSWAAGLRDGRKISYDASAAAAQAEQARLDAQRVEEAAAALPAAAVRIEEPEEAPVPYVEVTADNVKFRAAPNTKCEVLDLLGEGQRAVYLREEDGWYHAELDGISGYISADYATLVPGGNA